MDKQMQLAVNHVRDLQAARGRFLQSLGGGAPMDAKRPAAWCEYGWPEFVTKEMLIRLYRRGGLAHGAIKKLTGNCWKTNPWVIEGEKKDEATKETAWERELKASLPADFWPKFEEADRRRLVARYSGLILRIADNGAFNMPVIRRAKLVEVVPVWATALTPNIDTTVGSATYGRPKSWEYTETFADGTQGSTVTVHTDRIVILGDYSADAIGYLEPPYNAFINLEKVEGGSGEAFLKNASRQVVLGFDKEVDLRDVASSYGVPLEGLQEKLNEAGKAINTGVDTVMALQGATATTLTAQVPDPEPTYTINQQTAGSSLGIPLKIWVGSQTGERASTEDANEWNGTCQSYRNRTLSPEIFSTVRHLQRIKVVGDMGQFTVMWDNLQEATTGQKLANAKTMSEINQAQANAGSGQPTFSDDEVRSAAGAEARETKAPLPEGAA